MLKWFTCGLPAQHWHNESKQWCRYQRMLLSAVQPCGRRWNYNCEWLCEDFWWMPYNLNVRVFWISGAPLSGTSFLLAVLVELWVPENSHTWTLVLESHGCTAIQLLFGLSANRKDDGNGHIDGPTWDTRICGKIVERCNSFEKIEIRTCFKIMHPHIETTVTSEQHLQMRACEH